METILHDPLADSILDGRDDPEQLERLFRLRGDSPRCDVLFVEGPSMESKKEPRHVAVIMDGNGRWAARRGRPRTEGHRAGIEAARRVVEAAPALGIDVLTLYAFSSDNWRRPDAEVGALMGLFRHWLPIEAARCRRRGVRLSVIGRRDRLAPGLCDAIAAAERHTRGGHRLHVRLAVDYSARYVLQHAAEWMKADEAADPRAFAGALGRACRSADPALDVDLLIRTGGEQRLSDFLLWEVAYAELYFTDVLWPDFTPADLRQAVEAFRRRERRFGGLPVDAVPPSPHRP